VKVLITVIVVVVLIGGGVVGVGYWVQLKLGAAAAQATVVRTERPVRGSLVEIVSAPGEIEPKTKVSISARLSARIVELPFEEGDRVTKGDPNATPPVPASLLVRLDANDLEAALRSSEARRAAQAAEIKVAEARIAQQEDTVKSVAASLADAQRDLERQRELFASGDVSESDFEQARFRVEEMTAQRDSAVNAQRSLRLGLRVIQHRMAAADAEIAQARDRLSYTTITSPIDGIVTRLNAEVGELVVTGTMNNPGTVIIEVADLSKMLVVARVDESDIGTVAVGQQAVMDIRAFPDEKFDGVVDSIALFGTGMGRESKEFRVEILLDSAGRRFYTGLNADVEIETRRHENMLKIPSQAVLGRKAEELPLAVRQGNAQVDMTKTIATVVYCLVDGKAAVRPVKIGPSDETHTVIESGLTVDDDVIVGPYKILENLKHDQVVKDEKAAATQPAATAPAATQPAATRPAREERP